MMNVFAAAAGCVLLLLSTVSCAWNKDNSDRSLPELAAHMTSKVGGTVEGKVFPVPVKALDGISIRVEGREVFLYQYYPKLKKQKHKLDHCISSTKRRFS